MLWPTAKLQFFVERGETRWYTLSIVPICIGGFGGKDNARICVVIDTLPSIRTINDLFDRVVHDVLRKVDVVLPESTSKSTV